MRPIARRLAFPGFVGKVVQTSLRTISITCSAEYLSTTNDWSVSLACCAGTVPPFVQLSPVGPSSRTFTAFQEGAGRFL